MVRETLGQVLQLNHMQKCLCNCCLENELRFQAKKENFGTLRVSGWSGDVLAPLGASHLGFCALCWCQEGAQRVFCVSLGAI